MYVCMKGFRVIHEIITYDSGSILEWNILKHTHHIGQFHPLEELIPSITVDIVNDIFPNTSLRLIGTCQCYLSFSRRQGE